MAIKTNTWTHPTTGEIRHYIDTEIWVNAVATYHGEYATLSRRKKASVEKIKVWADEAGNLHVDHFAYSSTMPFYVHAGEDLANLFLPFVEENGGLDFIAERAEEKAEEVAVVEAEEAETTAEEEVTEARPVPRILTHVEADRTHSTGQSITLHGKQWKVKKAYRYFIESDDPSVHGAHLLGAEDTWGWCYDLQEI